MEEIDGLMRAKGFGVTAVNCYGFIPIFHHGYLRRVAGVIRICNHYSFYSFNAENSIHSIQKLMNGIGVHR